jgi:hypothetical protein
VEHLTSNQSPCSASAEAEAGLPDCQGVGEEEEGEEDLPVRPEASAAAEEVVRRGRRGEAVLCCLSGAGARARAVRSRTAEVVVRAARWRTAAEEEEEDRRLQEGEAPDGMPMVGEEAAGSCLAVPWEAGEEAAQEQQELLHPVEAALEVQSRGWEVEGALGFLLL